jgi:Fe-S cluster assembly iron-binding protein IscA
MLAMTEDAAEAVEQIVSQPEVPAGALLRIVAGEDRGNGTGPSREVELSIVSHPQARDLVVDEMRISVERRSLAFLDDKVLDAEMASGGGVEFKLYLQPGAEAT